MRGEVAGQPLINATEHGIFAKVDVQGMLYAVDGRVLGREPAAVVRRAVLPSGFASAAGTARSTICAGGAHGAELGDQTVDGSGP